MALKETIETEYKNALKSKDKTKISTYRLILSSIKDLDIINRSGPNKKDTDDEDIKKILKKMVKQRTESIDIYKKNNRTDLLEVEQNEYEILTTFLPKQLGEEETKKICAEVISKLGASSVKDLDIVNRPGPNKQDTDDEDIKKLLKKMVKQRAESIEIYKKNNRADLLEIEQNEYEILTAFLPKQLGEEETKKICANIISKIGASSVKDMGKVMGALKKDYADEIDFAKAGPLIKELLSS